MDQYTREKKDPNSVTYRQSTVFLSLSLCVLPNNLMSRRENFSLANVLDSSLAGSDCHSQNANDQNGTQRTNNKTGIYIRAQLFFELKVVRVVVA